MLKIMILVLILIIHNPLEVNAKDDFDFSSGQEIIDEYTDEFNLDSIYKEVKKGETSLMTKILEIIKENLFYEININKNALAKIMLLSIGAAMLSNFSNAFLESGISKTGYMVSYMMIIGLTITSFEVMVNLADNTINGIVEFMRAMVPAYFLAVGLMGNAASAVGFYEVILICLMLVTLVLNNFVIKAVSIYVMIMIVNGITKQDYLSKFADLIKLIVEWSLKGLIAIVLGLNIVKSLILPSVDLASNKVLTNVIKAIPGIGNGAEAVAEVFIGSGMLIKNTIGVVIIVGLFVIGIIPVVKMFVFILMYKLTGAILQPITDGKLSDTMEALTNGAALLLRATVYSYIMFALSISIVCIGTNLR